MPHCHSLQSHFVILLVFSVRYMPQILADTNMQDIVTLLVVFVGSAHYLSNPYLLAKLVEFMFVINPSVQPRTAKLNDQVLSHPLALDHLVPALMKFYTGNSQV